MRKVLARWWLDAAIILVVLGAGLGSHFWWLWHHHIPPESDYAAHLSEAAAFQAIMDSPGDFSEKMVTAWTWPGPYPQMVYFVTWVTTWFLPSGSYAALASLSFFIACLVAGAYILGSAAGGRPAGAAAALLAQTDPFVLSSLRRYWVDTPVAAMIVLSLALLHLSRGFTARAWSLAFGIVLALAMMSKFTACWYLTLPLLVAMLGPLRDGDRSKRLWFLGLLVALAGIFRLLCAAGATDGPAYMQGTDTMAPALSYRLLGAWLVACALYWTLASRRLDGPLRHLSHGLCLTGLLLAPWFFTNQAMIQGRWHPVAQRIPQNLAELPTRLPETMTYTIQAALWIGLLGMLVILLLKSRRDVLLPSVLALLSGTALTLVVLPVTSRYLAPSQALLAIMAVSWLPRSLFVSLPVLALAAWLASVNLFTDMALARAPALGSKLDPYSQVTRRFIVDQTDFPWTDFEPFSRELLARLGPTTSSIYILAPRAEVDRLSNLFYMLSAESLWQGRVVACRLVRVFRGRAERMQPGVLEPDRTRMLARRRGLPLERFPHMFEHDTFVPEIALVPLPAKSPEALAASIFGVPYASENFPPEFGFAVLRCAGAHGTQPLRPTRTSAPAPTVALSKIVTVHLFDEGPTPDEVAVPAGVETTFVVVNHGTKEHGFKLEGDFGGRASELPLLPPGKQGQIVVNLTSGTFTASQTPADETATEPLTITIQAVSTNSPGQ